MQKKNELLEVLKNILSYMDDNQPRSKKTGKDKLWSEALFFRNREDARRAIEKAEGK